MVPPQLLGRVYGVINFLRTFTSELELEDFISAEELYVAIEEMQNDKTCSKLVNRIAGSFLLAIVNDVKGKSK